MNKQHILKSTICLILLMLGMLRSQAYTGNDSIQTELGKAIGKALNERIRSGGSHVIDLNFSVDSNNHIIRKFRLAEDEKIWNMKRLEDANTMMGQFKQDLQNSAECYLAVIAIYNFLDVSDEKQEQFNYEYFQNRAAQAKSSKAAGKHINESEPIRTARSLKLMYRAVEAAQVNLDNTRPIIVYTVITYYVPNTVAVKQSLSKEEIHEKDKGKLYHQQGILYSKGLDPQKREDIISHLRNFRGGLNNAVSPKGEEMPVKEEQVLRTIQNICSIYKNGTSEGKPYDNLAIARVLNFKDGVIDGTALGEKKGKISEEALKQTNDYLNQINQGAGSFKVGMVVTEKNKKGEAVKKKAEEEATKDKKILVELELDESGSVVEFKYFNGTGKGGTLCQENLLKTDLEKFSRNYKISLDPKDRNFFTESTLLLYCAYRSVFVYMKCATDEDEIRIYYKDNAAMLAAAGFVNASMDMLDIFALVDFGREAILWAGKMAFQKLPDLLVKNTKYMLNIRQRFEDAQSAAQTFALTGKLPYETIKGLLPPIISDMLPTSAFFEQMTGVLTEMVDYLDKNKKNPYFYGQVTSFVVFSWTGASELAVMVKGLSKGKILLKISQAASKTVTKLENIVTTTEGLAVKVGEVTKALVKNAAGEWTLKELIVDMKVLWAKLGKFGDKLKGLDLIKEEGDALRIFKNSKKTEVIAEMNAGGLFVDIEKLESLEGIALATTEEMAVAYRSGSQVLIEESKGVVSLAKVNDEYRICRNGACFLSGTQVLTPNGAKNIEDISVDDAVYAFDQTTGRNVVSKVKQVFRRATNKIVQLSVAGGMLFATPEHPFMVNGGWVSAGELSKGSMVQDFQGGAVVVNQATIKDTAALVYNFEVEGAHTYYVGDGVLVHNKCSIGEMIQSISREDYSRFSKWVIANEYTIEEFNQMCFQILRSKYRPSELRTLIDYLETITNPEFAKVLAKMEVEGFRVLIGKFNEMPDMFRKLQDLNCTLDDLDAFLNKVDKLSSPEFKKMLNELDGKTIKEFVQDRSKLEEYLVSYRVQQGLTERLAEVRRVFSDIFDEAGFQGFKNFLIDHPNVSWELHGAEWKKEVDELRKMFDLEIGLGKKDRNISKLQFGDKTIYGISGTGYSNAIADSKKFISQAFVDKIMAGKGIFTPSMGFRVIDNEIVAMEYFASFYRAQKGGVYKEVRGVFRITSDLCPCPSCSAVFSQFAKMFPNVKMEIVTTAKLHY